MLLCKFLMLLGQVTDTGVPLSTLEGIHCLLCCQVTEGSSCSTEMGQQAAAEATLNQMNKTSNTYMWKLIAIIDQLICHPCCVLQRKCLATAI